MKKFILLLFVVFSAMTFTSCTSDEPLDPDNGTPTNPTAPIDDPDGTITLNMRNSNNGKTVMESCGIYIENDNFANYSYQGEIYFSDMGEVNGLGNVSSIPRSGWAKTVAVTKGHGYVFCCVPYSYLGQDVVFYRMFVSDYLVDTGGGIIGAIVKYQKPFKGLDEVIQPALTTLSFSAEDEPLYVQFKNSNIILFSATTTEYWINIAKTSTTSQKFLADGLQVIVAENNSSDARSGTINVKTVYGKEVQIKVNQSGIESAIKLDNSSLDVDSSEGSYSSTLSTNVQVGDLALEGETEWCKPSIQSKLYAPKTIKWIDENPVEITPESTREYQLVLNISENADYDDRTTSIKVKDRNSDAAASLVVTQKGKDRPFISFHDEEIKLDANSHSYSLTFTTNVDLPDITAAANVEWITAGDIHAEGELNVATFKVAENDKFEKREGLFLLKNGDGMASATVKIVQAAHDLPYVNLSASLIEIGCDAEVNNTVEIDTNVDVANLSVESSNEEWLSASFATIDDKLHLKFDAVENPDFNNSRSAVITVTESLTNTSSQLEVKQSKKVAYVRIIGASDNLILNAKAQSVKLTIETNVLDNLKVFKDVDWVQASIGDSELRITVDENKSLTDERTSTIIISDTEHNASASLTITQSANNISASQTNFLFDRYATNRTLTITTDLEEWETTCDADWVTWSYNGNQLTIRVTAAAETRSATIYLAGSPSIRVYQTKWAVKDNFDEDGVQGTVAQITAGTVLVYREVYSSWKWSHENVLVGADSESDGVYNTDVIKKIPNWETLYPSFYECDKLNVNGVTGWYMPAINELSGMKPVLTTSRYDYTYYFSSTEKDSNNSYVCYAYRQSWRDNSYFLKSNTYKIVAINKYHFDYNSLN